jgi:hypothetical protein
MLRGAKICVARYRFDDACPAEHPLWMQHLDEEALLSNCCLELDKFFVCNVPDIEIRIRLIENR